MQEPIIEPVAAEITGYVTYPGDSGPVDSSQPGRCGTHRYFATVKTNDGLIENYQIMGSASPCWQPPTLFVIPLAIGSEIDGQRTRISANEYRYRWFYRELPLVAPCNPGGG